jgi:hypothetical protein
MIRAWLWSWGGLLVRGDEHLWVHASGVIIGHGYPSVPGEGYVVPESVWLDVLGRAKEG